jgi:hypothetical protein
LKKLEVSEYIAEKMENDGILGHIPGMWKRWRDCRYRREANIVGS